MPFNSFGIPFLLLAGASLLPRESVWADLPVETPEAMEAYALEVSKSIRDRHMPFGGILDPIFTAPGSAAGNPGFYTRGGDSAIWTGHYLAAEAFRYAVTQHSDALENV